MPFVPRIILYKWAFVNVHTYDKIQPNRRFGDFQHKLCLTTRLLLVGQSVIYYLHIAAVGNIYH